MVFETKDQIIKRKRLARFRFRTLVRRVIFNKYWLSEIDEQIGEDAKRNIAIILSRKYSGGVITIIEKRILKTHPNERRSEDFAKLVELFAVLPCLAGFSPTLRKKLINTVHFQYVPKGKIIYLEDHMCLSMSFILTGEVLVSKLTFDPETKEIVDKLVNLHRAGEFFGYSGLLYNTNRTETYSAQSDCELLILYKEEFEVTLKATLEARHEDIKKALRRFEYFNNYTEAKIRECCALSKIEQFDPQSVIFSQHDISNFSFFVLSGQCMILQCLKLKEQPNGKCSLVLPKRKTNPLEITLERLKSITDGDEPNINYQFLDVGTLSVGAVFGINENMENRVIIARTVVQCLLIPRNWLFQKAQNIGNVWQRIKLYLNSSIPSQEKLFEEHLANQKWKKYKKKTIDQIKQQYNISDAETQYYNIPVICRIEHGSTTEKNKN